MKVFVNHKTKQLFVCVLLIFLLFLLINGVCAGLMPRRAVFFVSLLSVCEGILILTVLYLYIRGQDRIIEDAILRIRDYLAGNRDVRIECEEEGVLYRLFHEVNVLAAVLNAHAENESSAKKVLKDTISDISHQLKTPLAALNIYNGLIQEEAEQSPAFKEFTELSEQELDRIETLVQNLLKMAKLDAGTLVFEKTGQNVSEMMEEIGRRFEVRARQEGKTLMLSGSDGIFLACDRSWLMEAVSNLVKNAFDHTERGGAIRIEWSQSAAVVQIRVCDDGAGIHPEDLPYIFKRFYRSRFSKDTEGIGLGLPLAKAVIEAHRGTIEVDSEPGVGTVFTASFLIPADRLYGSPDMRKSLGCK